VRLFWEVARRAFRRFSTYRSATFAGVFTNTVFGFIKAAILVAVFRERATIGGFDVRDAVTFTFVSQGFLVVMGAFAGHLTLAERIVSGDVVTDLYRPVDLQLFELANDAGRAAFQCTVRAVVPLLAGGLVFDLRLPRTPWPWLVFALSVVLGIVTSFGHRFLVTMTTFWTLEYRAVSQMSTVVAMFFSGFMIPIGFFPDWLERLSRLLPYVGFAQIPIEVLLGKLRGAALVGALGSQVVWMAGLLLLGRWVLARATHRVVVQGG
jgi:ABC-2 type transport system permease protein